MVSPHIIHLRGLAPQSQLITGRAVFNTAYAVIPGGTNSDIVTSFHPFGRVCGCGFWRGLFPVWKHSANR